MPALAMEWEFGTYFHGPSIDHALQCHPIHITQLSSSIHGLAPANWLYRDWLQKTDAEALISVLFGYRRCLQLHAGQLLLL